jgi:hypothetical protein
MKVLITDLTNEQARQWLIHNDPEGADFWAKSDSEDLAACVQDNINDFGWDDQLGPVIVEKTLPPNTVKTSGLTPLQIDWTVAKIEGYGVEIRKNSQGKTYLKYNPGGADVSYSRSWQNAGRIIERENISVKHSPRSWFNDNDPSDKSKTWLASTGEISALGDAPLIAAMRCYVASKLGDTVEIPEDLL